MNLQLEKTTLDFYTLINGLKVFVEAIPDFYTLMRGAESVCRGYPGFLSPYRGHHGFLYPYERACREPVEF